MTFYNDGEEHKMMTTNYPNTTISQETRNLSKYSTWLSLENVDRDPGWKQNANMIDSKHIKDHIKKYYNYVETAAFGATDYS